VQFKVHEAGLGLLHRRRLLALNRHHVCGGALGPRLPSRSVQTVLPTIN